VQAQLVRAEGFPNLGLDSRSDITGFNWSSVPAILPELGFLTNPTEDRDLSSPTGQARAALGLCNGIVAFLNSERLHVRNRCSDQREQT
jgi:N-acetylmuramoyl-L-alanine amidase